MHISILTMNYLTYLFRTWYWRVANAPGGYDGDRVYRTFTYPIQLIQGAGIVYEDVKSILEPARLVKKRARVSYVVYSYAMIF